MAAQDTKDSLDVLQDMFNEALIQTGKALRASQQEIAGGGPQTLNTIPLKLPDTLTNYHNALDKIDKEIIRAKAVLGRDLERLRNKDANVPNPQPVDAQTRSPTVIDIDSSPVQPKTEPPAVATETKPVAPFPDMGMGMDITAPADSGDSAPQPPAPDADEKKPLANMAPEASGRPEEVKPDDPAMSDIKMDAPSENFTDMQFTLAPPVDDDAQGNASNQDQSFDMANFSTNDTSNGTIDLNSLLPASSEGAADSQPAPSFDNSVQSKADGAANANTDGANENANANFGGFDLDNMAWADGTDGEDFNFDINDDGTFDDLMTAQDNMNEMQHGQFDTDFFNLDNTDST